MRSLLIACLLLSGCNTMAGVGRDTQQGGAKLENKANQSQGQPADTPEEPAPRQ